MNTMMFFMILFPTIYISYLIYSLFGTIFNNYIKDEHKEIPKVLCAVVGWSNDPVDICLGGFGLGVILCIAAGTLWPLTLTAGISYAVIYNIRRVRRLMVKIDKVTKSNEGKEDK